MTMQMLLPAEHTTPAIQLQHRTVMYGSTPVLDALNLRIAPGQMIGLIEPNGAVENVFPPNTAARYVRRADRDRKRTRKRYWCSTVTQRRKGAQAAKRKMFNLCVLGVLAALR